MKRIGFFDIESVGLEGKILMIGYKELGKDYRYFDTLSFFDFLSSNECANVIYGFNSNRFDLLKLFDEWYAANKVFFITNTVFSGSLIVSFSIMFKDRIVDFVDLRGVFRSGKLNDISKNVVGEEKIDFDVANVDKVDEKLIEYNKRDVELLEKLYNKTKDFFGDEKILTIAGLSFRYFKRNYLKVDIKKIKGRGVKDTYFGGRTEIFRFYGRDVKCYDVNSLYPSIMADNVYPVGEVYKEKNINKEGYSFAEVNVPYTFIPFLPSRFNKKLMFLYGKLRGWWTNLELRTIKKKGCEVNVIDGYVCDDADYIFHDFIKDIYKKRLEAKKSGNKSLDTFFKLVMNTSYGKFGSKSETEYIVEKSEDEVVDGDEILHKRVNNGKLYFLIKQKKEAKGFRDYLIASYITAYARMKLYDYLSKVEDTVLYCDTDSIFVSDGDSRLDNFVGDDLGLLKLEYEGKEGRFLLPKMYVVLRDNNTIVKAKGIFFNNGLNLYKKDETINLTDKQQFERIVGELLFKREEFEIEQQRTLGFKESFRRKFDKMFNLIRGKDSIKMVRYNYDKRKIVDEVETLPYNIAELGGVVNEVE